MDRREKWADLQPVLDVGGFYAYGFPVFGEGSENLVRLAVGDEIHERLAKFKAAIQCQQSLRLNQNIGPLKCIGIRPKLGAPPLNIADGVSVSCL